MIYLQKSTIKSVNVTTVYRFFYIDYRKVDLRPKGVTKVQKTEKKITKGEKIMAIGMAVLIVLTGLSLFLFFAERSKSKIVEAGEGISQTVFTRTGAVVEFEEISQVESVEVRGPDGEIITETMVGKDTLFVLNNFEWTPFLKYRFDVKLKDGSLISTPAYAPDKPQPYKIFSLNFDSEFPREQDGNHAAITGSTFINNYQFSKDGKYLVLALNKGRLSVVDVEGQKEIWSKYIDNINWRHVYISEDNKYVSVGGTHQDAPVYVFYLQTGEEVWSYKAIQDFGAVEDAIANGRTSICQVGSEYLWVCSGFEWVEIVESPQTRHSIFTPINASVLYQCRARLYCFELSTGKKVWEYPKVGGTGDDWGDGFMNGNINGLNMDLDSQKYVLIYPKSQKGVNPSRPYDWVKVLDAKTGDELWHYEPDILPQCTSNFIYSSSISPDGKYVVMAPSDGRTFLFDNEQCIKQGYGSPKWVINHGTPKVIDGVLTNVRALNLLCDGKYVYCNSGESVKNQSKPWDYGLLHGGGPLMYWDTLYVYNLQGELQWSWYGRVPVGASNMENQVVDFSSGYMVTAYGTATTMRDYTEDKNSERYAYSIHPTKMKTVFSVLDLTVDSSAGVDHLCWSITTDAAPVAFFGFGGMVSSDGAYVAMLTTPLDYSPTGTPDTADIRGYYELSVYT